ncbi:MAG TPA: hypothetical protein VIM96_01335 [Pseudomonadales bacterium]
MATAFFLTLLGLIVLSIIAIQRRSGLRRMGRVLLAVVFIVLLLATIALVVGSIVLHAQGGGVLILFALPFAVITWIAGTFFFTSLEHNDYYALSTAEKIRKNTDSLNTTITELRESIARKRAEKNKFLTSPRRRQQLSQEIAHETMMLAMLPAFEEGLKKPEAYAKDEP